MAKKKSKIQRKKQTKAINTHRKISKNKKEGKTTTIVVSKKQKSFGGILIHKIGKGKGARVKHTGNTINNKIGQHHQQLANQQTAISTVDNRITVDNNKTNNHNVITKEIEKNQFGKEMASLRERTSGDHLSSTKKHKNNNHMLFPSLAPASLLLNNTDNNNNISADNILNKMNNSLVVDNLKIYPMSIIPSSSQSSSTMIYQKTNENKSQSMNNPFASLYDNDSDDDNDVVENKLKNTFNFAPASFTIPQKPTTFTGDFISHDIDSMDPDL